MTAVTAACAAPDTPDQPEPAAAPPPTNPGTPELLPPSTAGAGKANTAPPPAVPEPEHPCESRDDSADGLLGICTVDGVRYCVLDGSWSLCPGGGGEPCPAASASNPLAFSGRGGGNTVKNIAPLTAGRWRADICLWDSPYGPGTFSVAMIEAGGAPAIQIDGQWTGGLLNVAGPASGEPGVAQGQWSVEFDNPAVAARFTKWLQVTAAAGGEWTVAFTRLPDGSTG